VFYAGHWAEIPNTFSPTIIAFQILATVLVAIFRLKVEPSCFFIPYISLPTASVV
jgi:hypothetical protein